MVADGVDMRREGPSAGEMVRILRLAFAHRRDPVPYARAIAGLTVRYLGARGVEMAGARALDIGTGGGALPDALAAAGSAAQGVDVADRRLPAFASLPFVAARGERLPFADGSFDLVLSSNVLEHTADGPGLLLEQLRVCRSGGVVYLSWTNWYSPIGGHEWSPFHLLGPRAGPRAYRAVTGHPIPWNVPGRSLFVSHVGRVLRAVSRLDVDVVDVAPRYWPALRFLARIPALREVLLWNCVILMRKRGPA